MSECLALEIALASGSPAEHLTLTQLNGLMQTHDLRSWTWTRQLTIDEQAYPHSHPRLVLNTRYAEDPAMLLALFVHEQLHWFEESRAEARDRAIEATRHHFPQVPPDRPEGAGNEMSTRLHLLVCRLEFEALNMLCGEAQALDTLQRLSRSHYTWVYQTVLSQGPLLTHLLKVHDLWPIGLDPTSLSDSGLAQE